MRYPMRLLTLACTLGALAAPLHAQPPAGAGAPPGGPPPGGAPPRGGRPGPMRDGPRRDGQMPGPGGFAGPGGVGGFGGRGGPGAPGAGAGPSPAEFLLAHTGELQLTDQQVVRLAAIARRVDTRRRAERATLDSTLAARRRAAAADTARRRPQAPPFDEAALQRMRDQARTDLRDAIAVLTPDQQATAWLMRGPAGGGPGGRVRPGRGGRDWQPHGKGRSPAWRE